MTTDASDWQQRPSLHLDNQASADPANWAVLAALLILVVLLTVSPGFRWFFFNVLLSMQASSGRSRRGDGLSPGGFRGRGGSSGGGGASGSW